MTTTLSHPDYPAFFAALKARLAAEFLEQAVPEIISPGASTPPSAILSQAVRACFKKRPVGGPGLQGFRFSAISCRPRALTRRLQLTKALLAARFGKPRRSDRPGYSCERTPWVLVTGAEPLKFLKSPPNLHEPLTQSVRLRLKQRQ